ncbi:hypothetical protein ACFOOK_00090 [Micromonospora krabiensis]|uniref:Lipoprotein LprG n=1 Tax=Micromonospora krabiensis TaxID=307121 RepID=A0A1C3MY27_9ACTN|nr:hypothetical protein GA0070620_0691 [Micromonospora krabiensis]
MLGCSVGVQSEGEPAAPAPTVSADITDTRNAIGVLRAGTAFINQTSFRADIDIASQVGGLSRVDNVNKRGMASLSSPGGVIEIRMIDDDVYLKSGAELPGVGHEWMALDPARVPTDFALSFEPGRNDPGGSARLINAIMSARADGTEISGVLDVNRVGVGNGISFRHAPGGTFPEAARNQPFRATLDAEGRLVRFLIPEANGLPGAAVRYSDFGVPVDVVRPEPAVPAPDALYPQLGLGG